MEWVLMEAGQQWTLLCAWVSNAVAVTFISTLQAWSSSQCLLPLMCRFLFFQNLARHLPTSVQNISMQFFDASHRFLIICLVCEVAFLWLLEYCHIVQHEDILASLRRFCACITSYKLNSQLSLMENFISLLGYFKFSRLFRTVQSLFISVQEPVGKCINNWIMQ